MKKNKDLKNILLFLNKAGNLKKTYRYSETKDKKGDSSADHSWRLALMAIIVTRELNLKINLLKALEIALIHDLAEAITGDIDYMLIKKGKITKELKKKNELKAINKLTANLPPKIGRGIFGSWNEYEKTKTKEAKFIKALDKLETFTQTLELGYKQYNHPEYIPNYADKHIAAFPELIPLLMLLKKNLKKEFKKGKIIWKKEYEKIILK
jgi:putative hydrolase of HD superfamily